MHFALFSILALSHSRLIGWSMVSLDRTAATTMVRLWHEIHETRREAHDFSMLLAPFDEELEFYGVSHNEYIRAIAVMKKEHQKESTLLCGIAHHPDQRQAVSVLIDLMYKLPNPPSYDSRIQIQTRVFCELMYRTNELHDE